jgi:hypothetical protein
MWTAQMVADLFERASAGAESSGRLRRTALKLRRAPSGRRPVRVGAAPAGERDGRDGRRGEAIDGAGLAMS